MTGPCVSTHAAENLIAILTNQNSIRNSISFGTEVDDYNFPESASKSLLADHFILGKI